MLICENVRRTFGDKCVIPDFSFHFPEKGFFALTGESGKGKTTLLRLLCGLDRPDTGHIRCTGTVAAAFQEYRLFDRLTAVQNLSEVLSVSPEVARSALCDFGFSPEECDKHPAQLSGGMKQRVSLLRALLSDADILLLDEPVKELDPARAQQVMQRLKEESSRRLVIFTAHDLHAAEAVGALAISV